MEDPYLVWKIPLLPTSIPKEVLEKAGVLSLHRFRKHLGWGTGRGAPSEVIKCHDGLGKTGSGFKSHPHNSSKPHTHFQPAFSSVNWDRVTLTLRGRGILQKYNTKGWVVLGSLGLWGLESRSQGRWDR